MNGRGSVSTACCARAKFYSNGQCQLFRGGSSHLGMSVFCFSVKCLEGNTGDSLKYPVNCSGCVAFKFQEMLWNKSEKKIHNFLLLPHENIAWRRVPCRASRLAKLLKRASRNSFTGCFIWKWCECEVWNMDFCVV